VSASSHSPAQLDGASIPQLLEFLHSNAAQLRCDAACALGDRLRTRELVTLDDAVRERLIALLQDAVLGVRFEAAIALAEAQDPHATAVLLNATGSRALRLDAIRALGSGGDLQAVGPLTKIMHRWLLPWADRLQAAAALCALGDSDAAAYLTTRLTSRRAAERAAAIHFLGESAHPAALELLTQILQDRRDLMRDVAARALGLLRNAQARPFLQKALADADAELAHDIHEALARLPAPP
jgi:HEAT repeat protein